MKTSRDSDVATAGTASVQLPQIVFEIHGLFVLSLIQNLQNVLSKFFFGFALFELWNNNHGLSFILFRSRFEFSVANQNYKTYLLS